jgi:hypothetical protein
MIDYDKHEYTKVGNYSNVLYEWHPTESSRAATWRVELHEKMQPFIHKLAMAHPDWTFVMRGGGSHNDSQTKVNVHSTRVICEDEMIGTIELDTWKNGIPFEIDCPAIKAARERGRAAWTTKPEKAYKLVEQNFRPSTILHKMQSGRAELRNVLSNRLYAAKRRFGDTIEKLHLPLSAYISRHLEEIKASVAVQHHATLDAIPALAKEWHGADIAVNAAMYDASTYVMTRGGKYYVMQGSEREYRVMTAEELPEDLASKLGLLKALDTNDEFVDGVGMRTEKSIYFIL